jgi:hypothetical protein
MDRAGKSRWRFLNPLDWLRTLYETFGAKHPTGSLVGVMLLFGLLGGVLWLVGANLYEKNRPPTANAATAAQASSGAVPPLGKETPVKPPVQNPGVEQHSTGANSPNVTTGDNSPVNIK